MTTSPRPGSVVVGIDGSVASDTALEWAVHHARTRRRPLVLLHGVGDLRTHTEFVDLDKEQEVLVAAALKVTDHARRVVEQLAPGLEVQVLSPLADARDALVDVSAQASLVVVGTRGLGPVKRLLLGSVSSALIAHASCPVAVVRPASASAGAEGSVVVGTDGGPASIAALELAFELASTAGVGLDVVHSYATADLLVDGPSDDDTRLLAESLAGYGEKYPDVPVNRHLAGTGAAQTLVDLSKHASVVVVGSRGRTGWASLFASVSRDVVEHAHSTVIVVPIG